MTVLYVIIGLFALNLMVLIHECGHFMMARLFHIDIESLQLGFGPVIKRFGKGMTSFSIAAIPFGGLCKMDNLSLYNASPFKRILIYLSGPAINAISAIICFTIYLQILDINFIDSLSMALKQCVFEVKMFDHAMGLLLTGQAKLSEILSGAFRASESIGILTFEGFSNGFTAGICMFLYLFASVSLSLGVANLLPIPALDGGFIIISFTEMITRKTFSEKFYLIIQISGLILLLAVLPIARILY